MSLVSKNGADLSYAAYAVEGRIRRLDALVPADPLALMGLELRAVELLRRGKLPGVAFPLVRDPSLGVRRPEALFLRPSPEPALMEHWRGLSHGPLSAELLVELGSCLVGQRISIRTEPAFTDPDLNGVRLPFPPVADEGWLQSLTTARQIYSSPLLNGLSILATFLMIHPMSDGNGRLSRALFYTALARAGLLGSPILAVNAVAHVQGVGFTHHLRNLARDGDWSPFLSFGVAWADLCCDAAQYLLENT